MKTSHEMAQSVLEKRDRILRRRRILRASIGAACGTAAVAALVISLNINAPRGVDLINNTTPDPITPQTVSFDSAEKLKNYVLGQYPEAVFFEPGESALISPVAMGVYDDHVYYRFALADGGASISAEWDFTGNGAEKLRNLISANPDNTFEYAEIPGVYYSQAKDERTFYWVQDDCIFYAIIPDSAGDEVISLLAEGPYYFRNTAPLALIGAFTDAEGNYCVDVESWEILTDYADFRERLFGVWDDPGKIRGSALFTLDDTENSSLFAREGASWLREYYRVSDNVYAFIADWGVNSWLFWLDSDSPDTMYFEEMNGTVLYDHFNSGTDVLTRTDTRVNQPENGFLSTFRLREMAQEYGIDMKTLLYIEYDICKDHMLYHDSQYQSYPVYLVSGTDSEIVLRTKVGSVATGVEYPVEYTLSREDNGWKHTALWVKPEDYTDLSATEIPDIPAAERAESGFQAMGEENVLLDSKKAGELSILLVGDHVSTDNENHPGMINCFKFGIEAFDGSLSGGLSGAHFDVGQDGYWIYADRLSNYVNVFQFGDNYVIVLRYYESDGSCHAIFNAVKDGVLYPELMGDYSSVTGVQTGVTTMLSENLSADQNSGTITDLDSGISYVFDFDAISETYTRPHYTAVRADSSDKEDLSGQLAEMWLDKWAEITAQIDFLSPRVSVFSFDLRDGSRLAAFVYPNYKSYWAVYYRVSDSGITELGDEICGFNFELLENASDQYLHVIYKIPGSAMSENERSYYADDFYYRINESSLELVLRVGRNFYEGKVNAWYVYKDGESTEITSEEYDTLLSSAVPDRTTAGSVDLDMDGDYKADEYCAFVDDPEGLKAAILSIL